MDDVCAAVDGQTHILVCYIQSYMHSNNLTSHINLGFVWHLIVRIATLFHRNNHKHINLIFFNFWKKTEILRREISFSALQVWTCEPGEFLQIQKIQNHIRHTFLRWWWKRKWFCCWMSIFSSKWKAPLLVEKAAPLIWGLVSFCSWIAAERHGYGPQHVGGGLCGYAPDKHGGPCFLIMGTEIVRSGWCEVEGLWITTERATSGTAEKWRNTEHFVTTLITWKAPVFMWPGSRVPIVSAVHVTESHFCSVCC